MTQKRFDLGAVSRLQSRLGDVTKGGLIRNGFTEVRANKEVWSWQRPALNPGTAAPFVGSPLGMFIWGTTLYGVMSGTATGASGGTATSFSVYGRVTYMPFSGDVSDAGAEPPDVQYQMLSAVPTSWNGAPFNSLISGTLASVAFTTLGLNGTRAANFFTSINVGAVTLQAALAVVTTAGGVTRWGWTSALLFGTGTTLGTFAY